MARPVTIFPGSGLIYLRSVLRKVSSFGYDGVEIACWGDHMEVKQAATDPNYVAERKAILENTSLSAGPWGRISPDSAWETSGIPGSTVLLQRIAGGIPPRSANGQFRR